MTNNNRTATLTLPIISNEHGIVRFEDLAAEMQRHFDIEMNAKNEAYHFIASHGYLDEYRKFCKSHQGKNIDRHTECVNRLIDMLPDDQIIDNDEIKIKTI